MIKIKPIDVKIIIDFPAESNTLKPKFMIRDHVRILNYKKKKIVFKRSQTKLNGRCVIKIVTSKSEFRIEKVIQKNGSDVCHMERIWFI